MTKNRSSRRYRLRNRRAFTHRTSSTARTVTPRGEFVLLQTLKGIASLSVAKRFDRDYYVVWDDDGEDKEEEEDGDKNGDDEEEDRSEDAAGAFTHDPHAARQNI